MSKLAKLDFFDVFALQPNSVVLTYLDREKIFMDPDYQRESDIWPLEKRQLLIDSILNRFDIPKFYLHEYSDPKVIDKKRYRYAMIDGKQRLNAIWDFIDNKFTLNADMDYLHDPGVKLAGLNFGQLSELYPQIKARFDAFPLSIMVVRTDDEELIEDMFSRLNEAVPLNAAEKRNAFGGPLPPAIKELSNSNLFKNKVPFGNKRYRHFDIACKFLYLCYKDDVADTKKLLLDQFVKDFKKTDDDARVGKLLSESKKVTRAMVDVFSDEDRLLRNVGMIVTYFVLFRELIKIGKQSSLNRTMLMTFEAIRLQNAITAEEDLSKADYELIKFDELSVSLNDKYALQFRCRLICKYVLSDIPEIIEKFSSAKET